MSDELEMIMKQASDFAAEHIAARPGLSSSTLFPFDLWQKFGSSGLLAVGIPEDFGGQGLGYAGIGAAGRALARSGFCLGITLSWLMHQIVARFIMTSFGSDLQKGEILPGMAEGAVTSCIAISEPGVGGHPKHLRTAAVKTDGGYLLTGEKTYLTNGPIADLYIVLAISAHEGEKKRYSAFIVPRDAPGLKVGDPIDFGFLRPCPHGGIVLNKCIVPPESLIGTLGDAYEAMVLPFRDIEDTTMMSPILGAEEARLDEVASALRTSDSNVSEDITFRLGGIISTLSILDLTACEASRRLDDGEDPAGLVDLILAFRHIRSQVSRELEEVVSISGMVLSGPYQALTNDLDHIGSFAARVGRLRQIKLGKALMPPGNDTLRG
ncbi:MAG TPA: acyl-CoA dehydrogenase family protein [Desulfomonilia bacterium]|nr:acyl-CoA dehydrogenase family protein [Desulfomonilia bacterium]